MDTRLVYMCNTDIGQLIFHFSVDATRDRLMINLPTGLRPAGLFTFLGKTEVKEAKKVAKLRSR